MPRDDQETAPFAPQEGGQAMVYRSREDEAPYPDMVYQAESEAEEEELEAEGITPEEAERHRVERDLDPEEVAELIEEEEAAIEEAEAEDAALMESSANKA